MSEYRRLNLDTINFADTPLSFDEALKDVPPFDFCVDDLKNKKISITKAEKDYKNKCVKLEISY